MHGWKSGNLSPHLFLSRYNDTISPSEKKNREKQTTKQFEEEDDDDDDELQQRERFQ